MKSIYPSHIQIQLRSQKGSQDFYNKLNKITPEQISYYSYCEEGLKTKITDKDRKTINRNCFKTVGNDLVCFNVHVDY